MKVKELVNILLEKYDPEDEFVIALPPNWYKDEDTKDKDIWEKKGWTFDSVDYVIHIKDLNFASVCPLADPGFEEGTINT